jgi:hypothetical protein
MDDVLTRPRDATGDVPVVFDYGAVRRLCAEMFNANTHVECAVALDISPRTLDRLRDDPEGGYLRIALRLRARTGLSLDELFPAQSVEQPAA